MNTSLIVAAATNTHDFHAVTAKLHEFASSVAMLGCTTRHGIVLNGSLLTSEVQNESFSRGVCDPAGTFASDCASEEASEVHLSRAEVLSFALVLSSPGREEEIMDGMQRAMGDLLILGSSADNAVLEE